MDYLYCFCPLFCEGPSASVYLRTCSYPRDIKMVFFFIKFFCVCLSSFSRNSILIYCFLFMLTTLTKFQF